MRVCDDDLPAELAADLNGSFERFVLTYQDRIYAFALRLAGQRQDAEEIAQDAFVRAYHALQGYPAERVRLLALRPWLYQIALNVARNRARGGKLRTTPLDSDGVEIERIASGIELPEAAALRAEESGGLAALLWALPPRYREAVLLRHVAGLGYGEAASALGRPVGTVKSDVHRGIEMLRAAVERDQWNERILQG